MYIEKLQPISILRSKYSKAMGGFGITFSVVMFTCLVLHSYGGEQNVTFGEEEDINLKRQMRIIKRHTIKTIKVIFAYSY